MPDFSEAEKKIFSFMRGEEAVHMDPLALRRKLLQASGGRWHQLCKDAYAPESPEETPTQILARCDAQDKLMAVVRQAFALPKYEEATGKGAMEGDCLKLLNLYWGWLAKNARTAGS